MKTKTGIRGGRLMDNGNQTLKKSGVKVRSGVKSGGVRLTNENQTMAKSGLKVRSGIKGGRLVGRNKQSSQQ